MMIKWLYSLKCECLLPKPYMGEDIGGFDDDSNDKMWYRY